MENGFIEFTPSLEHTSEMLFKRFRVAGNIDEHHIKKDMAADFNQTKF